MNISHFGCDEVGNYAGAHEEGSLTSDEISLGVADNSEPSDTRCFNQSQENRKYGKH